MPTRTLRGSRSMLRLPKKLLGSTDNFTLSWSNGGARLSVSWGPMEEGSQIVLAIHTSSTEDARKFCQTLLRLSHKVRLASRLIKDSSAVIITEYSWKQ